MTLSIVIIGITIAVIIGLSFLNVAFFDLQCKGSCSGCSTLTPVRLLEVCPLIWMDEFGCERDCKVRNFQCVYDQEFERTCLNCINDCKVQYGLDGNATLRNLSAYTDYSKCARVCYT
jgi:hypothetical protein